MRLWLDTDIGSDVDDALALAYILARPELELVGISTVFGDLPLRGRIAEALLAAAGAPPVPLLAGLGVPLSERRHGIMFGHEGRGLFDDADPVLRLRTETGTDERLDTLAAALDRADPDLVAAIGPMTNLGALADRGTVLPPLAIMGGHVSGEPVAGLTRESTEWNWRCDPLAVRHVYQSEPAEPTLVVPAEVTFRTRLEASDIDRLDEAGPLNHLLSVLCRQWLGAQEGLWGVAEPAVALHDPLTTAVLVEPDLCSWRSTRLEIDDNGAPTEVDGPANAKVATSVDAERARSHIVETLLAAGS